MEEKRKKANWKCNNNKCKHRYSIEELEDDGFVEVVENIKIIECPNCGYKDIRKKQ